MNHPEPHPGAICDAWSIALCSSREIPEYVAAP